MTTIDNKKEYQKQLGIVKDDNNGRSVRTEAFQKLSDVYNNIISEEPDCKIDSPELIKQKFIDQLNLPDVIWPDFKLNPRQEQELIELEKIRHLAYVWVKRNHPRLNDQHDKFGQIVNARMQLIIASRS